MAEATDLEITISLKLFLDTNAEKVVFAEAGKDFVDILFYLLSLPLATVTKILKEEMVGSLGKLYETIEIFSESYLQPNQNKNALLNPRAPICATEMPLLLSDYELHNRKSYVCCKCYSYVADVPNLLCPRCKQNMTSALSYVPPSPANTGFPVDRGFIKGSVSFIVMDNLEFMPMSTKNLLPLLRKFNLQEGHELQEMDIKLDLQQVMRLLKLSLESKTVFTSFYNKLLSEALQNICKPM